MSSSVAALRKLLEQRFPDALPVTHRTSDAVPTGIGRIDGMLPSGGLPRGRMALWQPGSGASAVLQAACRNVAAAGERAAWVDAAGVVSATVWRAGPLLLRPHNELSALLCAEELLRCGGFGLVVLWGAEAGAAREAVRLSRAAKEGGTAFVAGCRQSSVANLRFQSRIAPDGYRWTYGPFGEPVDVDSVRIRIEASAMGWSGRTEVELPVRTRRWRWALDRGLVDRRGVVQFRGMEQFESRRQER